LQIPTRSTAEQNLLWWKKGLTSTCKIKQKKLKNWTENDFSREYKEKENLVWSEDGNTVEFEQRTRFEFNQELSGDLREDDEVVVLNAALMVRKT